MALSLYEVIVPSFQQVLRATTGFLDKAGKHFEAAGESPDAMMDARVHDDMLPFTFQIISVAHHSAGALAACPTGQFGPPGRPEVSGFASLQGLVAAAEAQLAALSPGEVNALEGKPMEFVMGERRMPFPSVEAFLLNFSTPNLHFHAATAYGLLRARGVPLGKGDYLARPRRA